MPMHVAGLLTHTLSGCVLHTDDKSLASNDIVTSMLAMAATCTIL